MKIMVCSDVEGLTEEKIKSIRDSIANEIREKINEEDLIITFNNIPKEGAKGPLAALGRSLERMADADAVYFADGYSKCRNGIISYTAARLYNKKIIRE